jgi:hypothetical protein
MNWYASLDHHAHYNNARMARRIMEIDKMMGEVMRTARQDPVLKKAMIFLVSENGNLGGKNIVLGGDSTGNESSMQKSYEVINTGFNLTYLFSGDQHGYNHWRWVVGTVESPKPEHDLHFLKEFLLQPVAYTYRGLQKNLGPRSLLLDYVGDNLAQIYLRSNDNPGQQVNNYERPNFYQLSHGLAPADPQKTPIDLPQELLNLTVKNVMISEAPFLDLIKEQTGLRPVKYFIMGLDGERARSTLMRELNLPIESIDRPPVLVRAYPNKTSVILCRRNIFGEDEFAYYVLKNFSQNETGEISAEVSTNSEDDPYKLLGFVGDGKILSTFMTDRQWLRYTRFHPEPTAIFSPVRILTLSPRLASYNVEGFAVSVPDFVLVSNRGFNFNSSYTSEADHGAFSREESATVFYASSLPSDGRSPRHYAEPVLTRDFAPTVLEYLGIDYRGLSQGQSLKGIIENLDAQPD